LAREFFQALASFYAEDVSKKDLTILETAVTETIGETDNIFGDDAFIGFNEIYSLKKYSKDLLDLRREMTIKASQFNLGRLVNGNLNPFNIAGFRGDDTNAPGVYIADWTKSFVGNPLFDFYTLIVECGLFEEKKMLEKIFFEEVGKVDKKLENSIREVYVDYINYFHILKFWLCVREYISLLIEKNSGLDVTVRSVLLRQTFEGIKLNIFKIAPRFEKMFAEFCRLCEKIGEGKIKQQEEETYD
jgi:hypothetical protein